jgi:hypothetical protein
VGASLTDGRGRPPGHVGTILVGMSYVNPLLRYLRDTARSATTSTVPTCAGRASTVRCHRPSTERVPPHTAADSER